MKKNLIVITRPQAVCGHHEAPDLALGLEEYYRLIQTSRAKITLQYYINGCSKCNRKTEAWVRRQVKHFTG